MFHIAIHVSVHVLANLSVAWYIIGLILRSLFNLFANYLLKISWDVYNLWDFIQSILLLILSFMAKWFLYYLKILIFKHEDILLHPLLNIAKFWFFFLFIPFYSTSSCFLWGLNFIFSTWLSKCFSNIYWRIERL